MCCVKLKWDLFTVYMEEVVNSADPGRPGPLNTLKGPYRSQTSKGSYTHLHICLQGEQAAEGVTEDWIRMEKSLCTLEHSFCVCCFTSEDCKDGLQED